MVRVNLRHCTINVNYSSLRVDYREPLALFAVDGRLSGSARSKLEGDDH